MDEALQNLPPEELNLLVEGGFYGHPYLSGNRIPRPEFTDRPDFIELAGKTIPPQWTAPAHWAVCGFTFTKSGDMYYASRGSWNSWSMISTRPTSERSPISTRSRQEMAVPWSQTRSPITIS